MTRTMTSDCSGEMVPSYNACQVLVRSPTNARAVCRSFPPHPRRPPIVAVRKSFTEAQPCSSLAASVSSISTAAIASRAYRRDRVRSSSTVAASTSARALNAHTVFDACSNDSRASDTTPASVIASGAGAEIVMNPSHQQPPTGTRIGLDHFRTVR